MKVTVAVLDKNGDSAVERVLDVLNSFDVVAAFAFWVNFTQEKRF